MEKEQNHVLMTVEISRKAVPLAVGVIGLLVFASTFVLVVSTRIG